MSSGPATLRLPLPGLLGRSLAGGRPGGGRQWPGRAAARRAQRPGLPSPVDSPDHGGAGAAVLPAVDPGRPGGPGRAGDRARRAAGGLHGVRRARAAGHLLDERRRLRLHLQRVPQAQVRQGLRRGAGYAAGPSGHRDGRDHLGPEPRPAVRRHVPARAGGHGAGPFGLAAGRGPRVGAHRLRVRRGRDGGHHLHAQLEGLRLRRCWPRCRCSCSPRPSTR